MARWCGWLLGVVLLSLVLLLPKSAVAQVAGAPDVVVLKDGSRFRGTIAELIKDGPVTIVLLTGETRKLEAADIAFAGPAGAEPAPASAAPAAAPAPPPSVEPPTTARSPDAHAPVRVRFTANRADADVFTGVAATKFKKVCRAPCAHDFAPALYTLGVRFGAGEDGEGKVKPMGPIMFDQPTTVAFEYRSRRGLRGAGSLVLTLGAIMLGGALSYVALSKDPDATVGWALVPTGAAAAICGGILVSVGDKVVLTVK
jgi:hypothetical protein